MLPFEENKDKNSRKYSCFVCGRQYDDFLEFKNHIFNDHASGEGREWIRCPLSHCGAPIRDVKLHCKSKHPQFNLKNYKGQLKATIWYDFNLKGKRKTRKPNFRQGQYKSTKTGLTFTYRSGLEEKVFGLLDQHDDVVSFVVEPFQIDYIWNGSMHKYTPDIIVTFIDGHKELWEVKPENQTGLEQNKAKWAAAEDACKIRNWKFEVYTESRVEKLKKQIQNMLFD